MFSATSAMSCYDSIQSVGDSSTDDSGQSSLNSFPSDSGENQTQGCDDDDDDIEEIVVYGYYTPSSSGGLLSGLIWALSLPAIGGITVNTPDNNEPTEDTGCDNGSTTLQDRLALATTIYNTEYFYHTRLLISSMNPFGEHARWLQNNGTGNTYTITWPDGSVSTLPVSGPGTSHVFLTESSCTPSSP